MNLKQIEDEALHLSEEERAELTQKLLLSLDAQNMDEIEEDWLIGDTCSSEENSTKALCNPSLRKRSERKHRP